jgi:hypothetical protein
VAKYCFVEFYGPQRLVVQRLFGLHPAWLARGPYALTAGFPHQMAGRFVCRAIRSGYVVGLADWRGDGVRVAMALWLQPAGPSAAA